LSQIKLKRDKPQGSKYTKLLKEVLFYFLHYNIIIICIKVFCII